MDKLLYFLAGAAIGSGITYYVVNKKSRAREDEAVKSVLDKFKAEKKEEPETEKKEEKEKPVKEELVDIVESYTEKLKSNGYTDYTNTRAIKRGRQKPVDRPYIITGSEFGEIENYETVGLNYFADGVLTDDNYDIVDDPLELIGSCLTYDNPEFDEDDVMYVRNDELECDYEITKDWRNFAEVDQY